MEIQDYVNLYRNMGLIPIPLCKAQSVTTCLQHKSCRSPGKTPLIQEWNQLKADDESDHLIDIIINRNKECNLGLLCGIEGDLIVVDVDGTEGSEALNSDGCGIDEKIVGPVVRSGRVGGYHYWFKPNGLSLRKKVGFLKKVDLLAENSYVIVPPSIHKNGNTYSFIGDSLYSPMHPVPQWIVDRIESLPEYPLLTPLSDDTKVIIGQRTLDFLEHGHAGENQRGEAIHAIVNLLGRGIDPEEVKARVSRALIELSPQYDPTWPWTDYDVERMVEDFNKKGVRMPQPIQTFEPLKIKNIVKPEFLDIEDNDEEEEIEEQDIVEGLIKANQSGCIFGESNSGKTLVVLDILRHIAAGKEWNGRRVRQKKVFLFELDDPFQIKGYIQTLRDASGLVVPKGYFMMNRPEQDFHLRSQEGMDGMIAAVEESGAEVICLDAFEHFIHCERFSQKELHFISKFKNIMKNRGKTVLFIDHTTKSPKAPIGDDGYVRQPHEWLRGGQMRMAVFDWAIALDGSLKNGPVTLWWAKFRGPKMDPMELSFNQFKGFKIKVLPAGELNRQEQKIIDVCRYGPRTLDDIATDTKISLYQVRQALNSRLIPRGLLKFDGDRVVIGKGVNPELKV